MNHTTKQYSAGGLLLYALPTIFTMIFMSVYMIVDGIFVAHYVGEDAFTAINIVFPVISAVIALGLMLATGASAVIGKLIGEQSEQQARSFFTFIYTIGIIIGVFATIVSLLWSDEILTLLQCTEQLYPYSSDYLRYSAIFFVASILQIFTQCFFITAGKPVLGFLLCFSGGVTNIILDYIFIGRMGLGIAGAGLGTGIGFAVPGVLGFLYFFFARNTPLYFVKTRCDFPLLLHSCVNGLSEFVTNIAVSITTFLFNVILLEEVGEAGVTAITAILYVQMFQMGIYLGYSFGVAPLISLKYGAQDWKQVQKIFKVSMITMLVASIAVIFLSYRYADFAIQIFIDRNSPTFELAKRGLQIYSFGYLLMGINIYLSSFFTALSNGKVSAILSCSRTLVFLVGCLVTLPQYIGVDGVWLAVPIAELLAFFLSLYFVWKYRNTYHYLGGFPVENKNN